MGENLLTILLIEDEPAHAELVRRAFEDRSATLGDAEVRLTIAGTLAGARACLADEATRPRLIIADWRLPDGESLELLTGPGARSDIPIVIMTSHGNERVAVEALKAGALDYVVKSDTTLLDMPHLAARALREWTVLMERAHMEQALRASEDRFRSLVQNSTDLITIHTADGTVLYETPSAARLLGYGPQGLIGRNPFEWVHPDDVSVVQNALAEVLVQGNSGAPTEYRLRHANGDWCYMESVAVNLLDDPGIRGLVLTSRDITGRKQAEAALRDSEERLRLALEAARSGTWNWDIQADCVTWSAEVAGMFGRRVADLDTTYEAYLSLIYRPDVDSVVHIIGASLLGKNQKYRIEHRVIWPDGSLHWVESLGQVYHDERGQPRRMTGTMADVSERKQSEEALRQYVERLTTLHLIDQAILAEQSIGVIAQATLSRVQRLVPNQRAGVILFEPETQSAVVVAAVIDGEIKQTDIRFSLSDFEIKTELLQGQIHVEQDVTELREPSPVEQRMTARGIRSYLDAPLIVKGELIGVLGLEAAAPNAFRGELRAVAREVADQLAIAIQQTRLFEQNRRHAAELEQRVADRTCELTAANEQLAAANERLAELDRLKSKFVSDVSHELRTPIANLKLYANLLERGKPEKYPHYLTVLKQQTQRLSQLVEDILDLSRLEIARHGVLFGPVDLSAVIDQIVTAHQPRAEAAGLTLTLAAADDLPPVRGDIHQLTQVMTNLIVNALNYTPQGWVRVTMIPAADGQVRVGVADSGLGIAPDDLPHIFDRFYRGRHARQRDIPGTGLGLAIVKEIVEAHQGVITVDSRVGEGTTFRVDLPISL